MPQGVYKHKKGYHLTDEWKRNIGKSNKGKKHPPQCGFQKGNTINLGRPYSKKHCRNISLGKKKAMEPKENTERMENGYVVIYKPTHPFCNYNGYVFKHRFIVEQYLGRYLKSEEEIHHINHNPSDNRIENLKLCKNKSEHAKIHNPKGYCKVWAIGFYRHGKYYKKRP